MDTKYTDLLLEFKDRLIIEVSAHDHFADVRFHSAGSKGGFYHNLIVSPGISPIKNQNPGYAVFNIDASTLIP